MPLKDPVERKAYQREAHRRWYEANKARRQEQIRAYKAQNKNHVDALDAEYRARPEVRRAATARKQEWRVANRERVRRVSRVWAKRNRHRLREYAGRLRRDRRAHDRAYYFANRDRYLQLNRFSYVVKRDGVSPEQYELMKALSERPDK